MVGNGWEMVGVNPTYVLQAGAFLAEVEEGSFTFPTHDGTTIKKRSRWANGNPDSEIRMHDGKPIVLPIPPF